MARRRGVAWAGAAATAFAWGLMAVLGAPPGTRLAVGAPAFVASLGFLQARRRFCVAYGAAGLAGMGPKAGAPERVADQKARRRDRAAAAWIVLQAAGLAALVALAAWALA